MSFLVKIKNANVYVEGNRVLNSLNWSMGENENWAIIGNYGTGKTTFMRLIFGELIPVYGGEVRWFGNKERSPLSEVRKKIGYVSAEYQSGYDRPALGWEVGASGLFSSIGDNFCKCGANNCVGYIVREGSRWRIKKDKSTLISR